MEATAVVASVVQAHRAAAAVAAQIAGLPAEAAEVLLQEIMVALAAAVLAGKAAAAAAAAVLAAPQTAPLTAVLAVADRRAAYRQHSQCLRAAVVAGLQRLALGVREALVAAAQGVAVRRAALPAPQVQEEAVVAAGVRHFLVALALSSSAGTPHRQLPRSRLD